MKAISLELRPLRTTQFWLLAIAGGIIATHLSLSWRVAPDIGRLSITILGWGAALSLLWEKRHTLTLETDVFSSFIGLILIAFVLLKSFFVTTYDSVIDITPFIAGLGLAMLASGVKGLHQYWQELIIILVLNAPIQLILERFDISLITAKFANFVLFYLGFDVSRQGVNLILPKGIVEVYPGCSGMEGIVRLLRLAVLFLVMFPTGLAKKILVPIIAVLVAFVVNGIRVALMAILVAYSNPEAFVYWHKGTGSQIFLLISMLVFGFFCYCVTKKEDLDNQDSMEVSES